MQELIAPTSPLASSEPGANLLLVRLEDWARDQEGSLKVATIEAAAEDFRAALAAFAKRASRPTLLFVAPPSVSTRANVQLAELIGSLERKLRAAASDLSGITVVAPDDVTALYPLDHIDDPESDRLAHIPFTPDFWVALGTLLARRTRSLLDRPYKVIVVDADNTLWGGVLGEVGAEHVQLSDEWRTLQSFLLTRKNRGMLLALVSKNREEDVEDVFRRAGMVLKKDDFVAWRVGWSAKSATIASLAHELELGLDSFLFLDDSPVECAEVAANCPAVTVVRVPSDPRGIPSFLKEVWAFDIDGTTEVDKKRTDLYRDQTERHQYRSAVGSFAEFIAGLRLQVLVDPLSAFDYERAAQLTVRTNQFNTTGVRLTTAGIALQLQSGQRRGVMVRVKDRFGDYGEVGIALFWIEQQRLIVGLFLMSCRVLGKGAEHRVVAALGHEALALGLDEVVIKFSARIATSQPKGS